MLFTLCNKTPLHTTINEKRKKEEGEKKRRKRRKREERGGGEEERRYMLISFLLSATCLEDTQRTNNSGYFWGLGKGRFLFSVHFFVVFNCFLPSACITCLPKKSIS